MKITKQDYRRAVRVAIPALEEAHPPYAKLNQSVTFTRKPPGAWVETWVWVPKAYVQMHKTKGK